MGWTTCWKCKERFGLDDVTEATLRRSGQTFHCPWGHPAVFKEGETEADILRRERDRLKQQLAHKDDEIRDWRATANDQREQAEHERRRANGYKGTQPRSRSGRRRASAHAAIGISPRLSGIWRRSTRPLPPMLPSHCA